MQRLLDLAKFKRVQAEAIRIDLDRLPVRFENGQLESIHGQKTMDIGLRVIHQGKIGFASASDLGNREELLDRAIAASAHGMPAEFDFPADAEITELNTTDDGIETVSADQLIEEGLRQADYLTEQLDDGAALTLQQSRDISHLRIANTAGADYSQSVTSVSMAALAALPGSGSGPYVEQRKLGFRPMADEKLDCVVTRWQQAARPSSPRSGRQPVLFAPESLYALLWRIETAISGRSLLDGISILASGMGESVADPRFTLWDRPHFPDHPHARAFDDEGVPTSDRKLIDKGVFTGFLHSLDTAARSNSEPTGNGYKMGRFESGMRVPPLPSLYHATIDPGERSSDELIKSISDGLVVHSLLGAHSGNIPAGQLSVSVGIGYHVKDGEVVGRATDTMLFGNVWDMLTRLGDISLDASDDGLPWLLIEDVDVTAS